MYDYNITIQEISDYIADVIEISAEETLPSEEEMAEMAAYYGEE